MIKTRLIDNFDFAFNPKINRSRVFDLATGTFIDRREDALFLGPGGTGKSHLAQAIGQAVILQGHKVIYRETTSSCKISPTRHSTAHVSSIWSGSPHRERRSETNLISNR